MRLIGMGLLAFVLAAAALFLSSSETLQLGLRSLQEAALGPQLQFETDHKAPKAATKTGQAVVQRTLADTPIILSGFPAYQGATFFMPIDARPTSGHLQIDATIQSLTGIEGVLRISIDNAKRAELLLRPGEAGRSLRIDLTEADIVKERLVVSFSLQGQGPHRPCSSDEGFEAIVEIETTSAIILTLEEEISTPRDRALIAGGVVPLALPREDQAEAMLAALALQHAGMAPRFDQNGIEPSAGFDLAGLSTATRISPKFAWGPATAPNASLFGMRKFQESHSWRVRYDMGAAQSPRLPKQFELDLFLGPQMGQAEWQIVVTLNNRILDHTVSKGGAVKKSIALPPGYHARKNALEITVSSTADTPGICNEGPELFAEIREDTRLIAGADTFSDGLAALQDVLSEGWTLKADALGSAEALAAVQLLSELPKKAQDSGVTIRALPRGAKLEPYRAPAANTWLIFRDGNELVQAAPISGVAAAIATQVTLAVVIGAAS